MHTKCISVGIVLLLIVAPEGAFAQPGEPESLALRESAYYVLETVPVPDDVVLEVGGMALLPSGDLAVATRRGEIWTIENPSGWGSSPPFFRLFARGLHEPLGLAYRDGAIYATQRGELSRLTDSDGNGRADRFETVYAWPLSGNYHEYSFGPVVRDDGTMVVTLNLGSEGDMQSLARWRGWTLEISPQGDMRPIATGMRSPAGIMMLRNGDLFYAENQGDWIGSGWVTHLEVGDFVGHPAGLKWAGEGGSPVGLRPEDIPDTGEPMFEVAKRVAGLKPPAVWFPHGILGVSTSGLLEDTTGGAFGPFDGQVFVGDQGHSKILRMALERVEGVYQGVAFPFREGLRSGVLRMIWDREGAMYVGMTSRGWDATGGEAYGLQRIRWSGKIPFEAQTIRSAPDGFEIQMTMPLDPNSAIDPSSFQITSFTYKYHHVYGSPAVDQKKHVIRAIRVAPDGQSLRLAVEDFREGYIYEIKMPGLRSKDGRSLLHDTGYFTLNRIPEGEPLSKENLVAASEEAQDQDAAGAGLSGMTAERPPYAEKIGPKRQTEMPSGWGHPDRTITVGTLPGLRFDLDAFEVAPGDRVEIVFRNDDDMLHNLVVVMPGAADAVASKAMSLGLEGAAKAYVPDSPDVLYHTDLLQPGAMESIYFTAPLEPGEYVFVCTFPGHAATMRGIMRVAAR